MFSISLPLPIVFILMVVSFVLGRYPGQAVKYSRATKNAFINFFKKVFGKKEK